MIAKLTNKVVADLKPTDKPFLINDAELKGFAVRVEPGGAKTFLARYRHEGRQTSLKVGTVGVLPVAEARDRARAILADSQRGLDPVAVKRAARAHTIGEFLTKEYGPTVLAHKKDGKAAEKRIKTQFKDLLTRKLGDETVGHALANWRARRLKAGKAPATVNRDLSAIRSMLSWAVQQGFLKMHPFGGLKPLKLDTRPKVRFLTEDETARLLEALNRREERIRTARDSHNVFCRTRGYAEWPDLRAVKYVDCLAPMILLSLNTGARRGELFNLRWEDVDLERRILTVGGQYSKSGNTRHIPVNSVALEVLTAWHNQAQAHGGLVFPNQDGERFDNVNGSWESLRKDAGLLDFRWHDMRHDFASKLVIVGVDLNTVRELLGHSDIKMTLRYSHLSPAIKAAAVERIAQHDNVVQFPAAEAQR